MPRSRISATERRYSSPDRCSRIASHRPSAGPSASPSPSASVRRTSDFDPSAALTANAAESRIQPAVSA